jgi:hypothetical protein
MMKWAGVMDAWERLVKELDNPAEGGSASELTPDASGSGAQLRCSFRILAQALYPSPVEAIVLAGASPDIAREIRKRHTDLYFQHWRVVKAGLRGMVETELTASVNAGEWIIWLATGWKAIQLRYYLTSLAASGLRYSLGMRANPRSTLQELARLFAIADGSSHSPQG